MGFGSAYFNFIPGVLWVGLGRTLWILGVFWRDGILKEMPCKRFIRVRPITLYSTRRFIRQEKDFAWLLIGRLSLLPNSPLGRWGLAAEWLWCRGWWCLKNLRVWRMMMMMMYRSGDYPWWKPWRWVTVMHWLIFFKLGKSTLLVLHHLDFFICPFRLFCFNNGMKNVGEVEKRSKILFQLGQSPPI